MPYGTRFRIKMLPTCVRVCGVQRACVRAACVCAASSVRAHVDRVAVGEPEGADGRQADGDGQPVGALTPAEECEQGGRGAAGVTDRLQGADRPVLPPPPLAAIRASSTCTSRPLVAVRAVWT